MSDYTPTRNEMLTALVIYRAIQREKPPRIEDLATPEQAKRYLGEAERGLAEVERAAAARALDLAADEWTQGAWSTHIPPRGAIRPQIILGMAQGAGDWLRARAAEMRGET